MTDIGEKKSENFYLTDKHLSRQIFGDSDEALDEYY